MRVLFEARHKGEIVTGLLYVNPDADDLCTREALPATPLAELPIEQLRPTREQWDELMARLA